MTLSMLTVCPDGNWQVPERLQLIAAALFVCASLEPH